MGGPDGYDLPTSGTRYIRTTEAAALLIEFGSGLGRITMLHTGWGASFLDYDNDGWKDLLIAQGHDIDTIELNFPNLPIGSRCFWRGIWTRICGCVGRFRVRFFIRRGWAGNRHRRY